MKIDLIIESDSNCGFTPSKLESVAEDIFSKLNIKKPLDIVEVFLVTNDKIASVNKKYRGIDKVTDVLSFPQEAMPAGEENILGTIFIAPEFAKSEDIDPEELFVHGLLHLLGFDHETNIKNWQDAEKQIERIVT